MHYYFDDKIEKDNINNLIEKIDVDEEASYHMNQIVNCMEEAQTYTFQKINPNLKIKGKAEAKAAPFWLH